jgi:hypothetical protein
MLKHVDIGLGPKSQHSRSTRPSYLKSEALEKFKIFS